MLIPLLEEEMIILDYLDTESEEPGFHLVEFAPDEAHEALASYKKRAARLRREHMMVEE